jgi:hypothetical protein
MRLCGPWRIRKIQPRVIGMSEWLWSKFEFLGELRKHPIARWVIVAWAVISIYDTGGSQLLPTQWAQNRPTVYQVLAMTTGWLSWQAWLLIGALVLTVFALEYPARQKRHLAAKIDRQGVPIPPGGGTKKMSLLLISIICGLASVGFFFAWLNSGTIPSNEADHNVHISGQHQSVTLPADKERLDSALYEIFDSITKLAIPPYNDSRYLTGNWEGKLMGVTERLAFITEMHRIRIEYVKFLESMQISCFKIIIITGMNYEMVYYAEGPILTFIWP